ncbi:N-acetylmuramoyl-L-alanine amidase [Winogradskyella helgolandensis]|uniref:N-acetylmuramoyl-L-alanine amidase n=1 Tax=Winogradskyella helgolandensis TaxID=2697010 RepID=UPI0015CB350A|nr:N-acetylmuramoyl-L-alanine amidase [Winogradskyella helgolandensis]
MISYFIYTIISLGCSYVLYVLLLRKQKTFQFNRFFLIGSILLCLAAPFMEIELFKSVPSITEIPLEKFTEPDVDMTSKENGTFGEVTPMQVSSTHPLFYIYLVVAGFFLFRFLKNLFQMYRLTRQKSKRVGKLKLITITDSEMVSSFFNYMFMPKNHVLSEDDYLSIIAHETVHSKELHTVDIILLEVLHCIFWFNPFIWLYKKAILQNHEFLADEQSVLSGIAIENYSNTIINLGQKDYRVPLTSGFNFIQIKNRIIMLHQSKSSVFKRTLNIISVILLFTSIFVFSSYKELKEPLVVVIDAGHGGHDSGNLDEKNIVLNISHQLSLLSSDNIRIITTRTEDTFFTLQERVEFINTQNADLVVSLHANAHSNPLTNGVEAYYNDKDEFKDKSYAFGKILLENQMELFSTNRGLKTVPMYIFRHINSPGVLLELGFITNEEDHKVLMNVDRQKEIAASIFEGLEEIRNSN